METAFEIQKEGAPKEGKVGVMAKKKKTKAEKRAYARAYAKRMTHGKVMDAWAAGGAIADRGMRYMETSNVTDLKHIAQDYAGFDIDSGQMVMGNMVRGYVPSLINQGERTLYNFVGIQRPRTKIENINDVIDYITYHGKAGVAAWDNRANMRAAHNAAFRVEFGVDLNTGGWDAVQLEDWFWGKQLPYIIGKKVRQIPAVRRGLKKLNLKFA